MRKILILVSAVLILGLFLVEREAGKCGFGYLNRLPYGIKGANINGLKFEDSTGWGIITGGAKLRTKQDDEIIIRQIQKISYNNDVMYIQFDTMLGNKHPYQALARDTYYVEIRNNTQSGNLLNVFSEKEFQEAFKKFSLPWIDASGLSCSFSNLGILRTLALFLLTVLIISVGVLSKKLSTKL
ncbi:hypothetical protein [Paremcibacter congregatus]|uniref:Uncharacterized protein n=1 Tax=Paremcibacter congregatus TaxID=2043170 RepID=A0A2G4YNY2_9PROT|nr:hypothetical protein [Paremcibacter congregatus]PHZ84031.1 hypothetical protein CRD36_13975 [Paremcibacter congregatus]QDE28966.1 hypothetical protein FIV45_17620 [Paremcibacter congregatus]